MSTTWILVIAAMIFSIVLFLFWKLTIGPVKKEYGEKRWKLWGQRTFYWQDAIYISTGITCLLLFLLRATSVLTF